MIPLVHKYIKGRLSRELKGRFFLFFSELIQRRQARVVRGVDFRITESESALPRFAGSLVVSGQVTSSLVPI